METDNDPEVIFVQVLQKGLTEVGRGWYTGTVSYFVERLNGLLKIYAVSPAYVVQYHQAYRRAMKKQPCHQTGPVVEWLARFEKI